MRSDWEDDESIGYGRPPRYTRFRKGQSGNPKGRPKKPAREPAPTLQSAVDDALRKELEELVTIRTPSGPKAISKREAVMMAQMNGAIKGNSLAQRHIYQQALDLEERDRRREAQAREEEEHRRQEQQNTFERMVKYKALRTRDWAMAETEGREPDDPWPHPDDILLYPAKLTYRIRGPYDEIDLPYYEYCRAERDVVFVRSFHFRADRKGALSAADKLWVMVWVFWDLKLPRRWQLNCNADDPLWRLPHMRDRDILDLLDQRIAEARRLRISLGIPETSKEGYRFANSVMKPLLKHNGYRSLAQFERAYEETGGDPPWLPVTR